jgi:hypothetical protein
MNFKKGILVNIGQVDMPIDMEEKMKIEWWKLQRTTRINESLLEKIKILKKNRTVTKKPWELKGH